MKRTSPWVLIIVLVLCSGVRGQTVYWADPVARKVERMEVGTTEIETIAQRGLDRPWYLELDPIAQTVYWIENDDLHAFPSTTRIRAMPLSGGEPMDVLSGTDRQIYNLVIAPTAKRLFWLEESTKGVSIRRCDQDGTNEITVLDDELVAPRQLQLDEDNGLMYWVDALNGGPSGKAVLKRATLDGDGIETIEAPFLDSAGGLVWTLDPSLGHVYWCRSDVEPTIYRSNYDGSNVAPIALGATPWQMRLDVTSRKLYWRDLNVYLGTGPEIRRVDPGGGSVETIVPDQDPGSVGSFCVNGAHDVLLWVDSELSAIVRSTAMGKDVSVLVGGGVGAPVGVTLDLSNSAVYWTDFWHNYVPRIETAALNGERQENLAVWISDSLRQLSLDPASRILYWTSDSSRVVLGDFFMVWRMDLGDLEPEGLVTSNTSNGYQEARGLAIDHGAKKLYWAIVNQNVILRADLDGTNVETVVSEGISSPHGVALDPGAGYLYWSESTLYGGTAMIRRAPFSGGPIEDLITSGLDSPRGLAVDLDEGKLYWVDAGSNTASPAIGRADLDGSNVEMLVTEGLVNPVAIAFDSRVRSDCDGDRAVLESDLEALVTCLMGPGLALTPGCGCADANGNREVDLLDIAEFQRRYGER